MTDFAKYRMVSFSDSVVDVSHGNARIPQSDFHHSGELAIVDQGQSLIAGYTDDVSMQVNQSLPLIVFGDHTRIFKYIDFPFAMGADGIKILKAKDDFNAKFLYYYFQYHGVLNAGYSRHFKFLKEMQIPLFSMEDQEHVVAILDRADAICAKRRQLLAGYDELRRSVFDAMFAKGHWHNVRSGVLMPEMRNGLSPSRGGAIQAQVLTLSAITQGNFDATAVKAGTFDVVPPTDKRVTSCDFMMCRGNGNKALVGAGVYSDVDRMDLVFPDTVIAGKVDTTRVLMPYLAMIWNSKAIRGQIERLARTTNGTYKVNQQALSGVEIPLPPLSLQQEFARRVEAIAAARRKVERALALDDELFASLQSRAFRGEL